MRALGLEISRKLMRGFSLLGVLLMTAASASVSAAGDEPIRLWKITPHPGTTVFILGISHFGSRLEQDSYFHRTVLSAFDKSDVLHIEGGERTFINELPECPHPLKGKDAEVVKQARDLLRRGAVPYFRTVLADLPSGPPSEEVLQSNAASYVRDVSEFGLLLMLRLQYQFLHGAQASVQMQTQTEVLATPVVKTMMQRRPNIDIRSVDEKDDLWAAYCGSNARAEILKWHLQNFDPEHPPAQASAADAADQVENSARQIFVDRHIDPNPFLDMFVCPRNERWLPRLLELDDGKTHFEALGAAHLFPYEGITRRCDGLLQDLRRRGVAVTPVP
nr:hypothetical protein [uncultured Roseateles sp.]